MDFDFGSFFVGVLVGLFMAYGVVRILGRLLYHKLVAEGVIKSEAEESGDTDSQRIQMKVEQHGDVLYAFRKDTDDFVCQGANFEELRANFARRFPGHTGSVEGVAKELHDELARQRDKLTKSA